MHTQRAAPIGWRAVSQPREPRPNHGRGVESCKPPPLVRQRLSASLARATAMRARPAFWRKATGGRRVSVALRSTPDRPGLAAPPPTRARKTGRSSSRRMRHLHRCAGATRVREAAELESRQRVPNEAPAARTDRGRKRRPRRLGSSLWQQKNREPRQPCRGGNSARGDPCCARCRRSRREAQDRPPRH
jgi:hypothetical protein